MQDYNLTDEIKQADEFTVFAPTDAAVTDYLKKTAATVLVQETPEQSPSGPVWSQDRRIIG